jgi:hypothetical protein
MELPTLRDGALVSPPRGPGDEREFAVYVSDR